MSWANVAGAAIGVVGGALSSNDQGSQTATKEIDPRIVPYIYGSSGAGGLLGDVNNQYSKQFAQGGLNPLQNAGLELQRQALMDPRFTQGFDQMRNLGSGLLSQGVAGNPFTGGQPAFGRPNLPQMMQAGGGNLINSQTPRVLTQSVSAPQGSSMGMNSTTAPAYQQIIPQTAPPAQASLTQQDLVALLAQLKNGTFPGQSSGSGDNGMNLEG